ncbi:cytochrome c3 family protein [Botrimarina mediterranea]|uniref:Uncharacterized protein n=1 Tax=Botrimarina mediterranea TaxID=2528022 RepID=A0A518KET2_9BACT|nr:cytochrome c3 family protein [Botrimarina mediterranea]QDV76307.1 hypothetical protein Spa11_45370 [Botrimarina mediterranea]QDV80905.1 hypothetical protein K2D_45400 [Planctomycetes bacterium K2D]
MAKFHFPPWVNTFSLMVIGGALAGAAYAGAVLFYGTLPKVMYTGYQPEQPVPYSHKLHAGELKIDCRYCHNTVDKAGHAAIPPTATCGNCHNATLGPDGTLAKTAIHTTSVKLTKVRESLASNESIQWEKIHDLADYVYFNHSAHVNKGVGCVECHGRVDKMEVVHQDKPLSMSWCLDCHRDPTARLRPLDQITNMEWDPELSGEGSREKIGAEVAKQLGVHPNSNCSTCHR